MSSRLVGLATVIAVLAVPQAASASPGWVAPINFPLPATASTGAAEIRYQAGGIATEAFLQVDPLAPLKTTAHFGVTAPGGSYTDQLTIPSTGSSIPIEPQVAVAPDGAAVATWIELNGGDPETALYSYHATYRPAGSSTWEPPIEVAADSERPAELREYLTQAISANGTAAVGVQRFSGLSSGVHKQPDYLLEVDTRSAGGSWLPPVRLSPTAESVSNLSLAFDGQGDLTAAYTRRFFEGATEAENRDTVITDRRPASNGLWGPEENLTGSEPQWTADALQLGENEDGDAVIAYQYVGGSPGSLDVWAVTREEGQDGTWSSPQRLVTRAASSVPLAAAVIPGYAVPYVLYDLQGENSGESCVGVAQIFPPYSKNPCLSPVDNEGLSGSIAFIGDDAYFAWSANAPGEPLNGSIESARWLAGSGAPQASIDLDLPDRAYGAPTLVTDGLGNVVAFYTASNGVFRSAAYVRSPPILLAASVPSVAIAGQPVSVSASFTDLWSGLGMGQPTWSFGDESAPVAGASVTHTFSTPGVYTVTMTAADALGNTTSKSYEITVSPSAPVKPPPSTPPPSTPPTVTLQTPACGKKLSKKTCKRFRASRAAWRMLTGQVFEHASASGLANVQVAVYLTSGNRIEGLSNGHFRKTTQAKARATFVMATLIGTHWSLRLPTLKAGTYTVLVRATSGAGVVSATISKTVQLR
jgi:hypothetical protein